MPEEIKVIPITISNSLSVSEIVVIVQDEIH